MKQLMYQVWFERSTGWQRIVFTTAATIGLAPLAFDCYEQAEADAKRLIKRLQ